MPDIADSLDEGVGVDPIIIDFSKAFDLVPHVHNVVFSKRKLGNCKTLEEVKAIKSKK